MATATRTIRAPRGTSLSCKGWPQEAALRMLMNNLDPDVAERPDDLVVYGGTGKATPHWGAVGGTERGGVRRDRGVAAVAQARQDAARAVGQAGRRLSDAPRRASRAD